MSRLRFSVQDLLAAAVMLVPLAAAAITLAWFAHLALDLSPVSAANDTASLVATSGLMLLLSVLAVRYLLMLGLAAKDAWEQTPTSELLDRTDWPSVSIIMPVYNESKLIGQVLERLFALDYPDYEILVIDDGSSDNTFLHAMLAARNVQQPRVRILPKPNGGKSDALNHGLSLAGGEIVVCIDGDAVLDPLALKLVIAHFDTPAVGAVAGNVRVSNRDTAWGVFQALEYALGLGLMKRAQSAAGAVAIVPGPLGAFRKEAVARAGGYDHDTFAEDFDLTLKLLEDGWQVIYESRACVFTEAPETLMQLMKQRYRWSRGSVQVLRKRWHMFRQPLSRPWAFFGVCYLTLEMMIMPVAHVTGLILFALGGLASGTNEYIGVWWLQLLVLDASIALFCVVVERERWSLVAAAPLSRVFYQVILDVLRIFATIEEFMGVKMGWGKLKRLGKMS
jgi:poly-beta-1,6-N-acetyl-D-glucosamine synthase